MYEWRPQTPESEWLFSSEGRTILFRVRWCTYLVGWCEVEGIAIRLFFKACLLSPTANLMLSQVDNTDAEGRLILADALCYADQFNPRCQQINFFFLLFFWYLCIFFASAAPQRPTCSSMPTLLAPQQGITCPCRLERCRI